MVGLVINCVGFCYDYFLNASKTILIAKQTVVTSARTMFGDCDIKITAIKDIIIWEV